MKLKFNGFLVLLIVLVTQITFAQERAVSGVVSDNAGLPLPGVSVLVKETKAGTQTDFDGKYSIKATSSQTLIFSYIGMKNQEIKAGSAKINLKMQSSAVELEGVIVTAFGIKKQRRSVAYATSTVGSKELTEVTNTNIFESLSGKVSGVDITAPAQVGASSKVIIRGFSSLSNNSPLYIVDGSPIDNSSVSGTGTTRSFDGGNGIGDIDPNNIENISILKGAAASALYGSRAANGVILITTKSAKNNAKIAVEILSSSDFSNVSRVAHLQNDFGQGWAGKSWSNWAGHPENSSSNENGSWGPAFNGEIRLHGAIINSGQQIKPYVALKNNIKDFYERGSTYTNSVRVSGGGTNSNFSLNFSDVNSNGIIPTDADSYKRRTFGLNAGITSDKLSVKTSINYVKKDQNAVNTGQGSDAGEGNVLTQDLLQFPRDISVVDQKNYMTNPYASNSNYFTPYATNPYWDINENATTINGNRVFGNVNLNYAINKKLSLNYQAGGDFRIEDIKSYGAVVIFDALSAQDLASTNGVVGGVTERSYKHSEFDTNLNLNYNTTIKEDYNLNALLGFNTNERNNSYLSAQITNLDIPNFYELSNSSIKPTVAQSNSFRRSFGAYASIEASYKNKLFLTLTGRNDWTSTLPIGNNSYFYPSASLSGVVIDETATYMKLRVAYAQIGNDTSPFQTASTLAQGNASLGYGNITLPIGGVNGYEFSSNLGNSALKPERTNEFEIGFESTFLNKRVNLDASVYNKKTSGLLFSRPVATSTGFSSQTTNLLDVTNKGIELVLNLVPIKSKDFQWDFTTTFTKNLSNVESIVGGVEKIQLATNYGVSFNAVVGQPLGVFASFVPVKNTLGQYVVDPGTGFYKVTEDEQNIGTSQRNFIMGFKNKFTYKHLALTIGIDWKEGGKMYSYTKRLANFTGNGIETTFNNRNTFIIPNSVVEVINGSGVVTGYAENTTAISASSVTDFYNTGNNQGIEKSHIIDKTFVRLRDIALTYNVPSNIVKKLKLTNASFSIYGKNLALWTPNDNPYVDPEISTFGSGLLSEQGEFASNPSQLSYGASIKLTF
jgi:TonB-linked SusC/RagA family outer membrane protein